ncbi:MAG: hypothetical protein IT317_03320 [Anaerolineales bacterium]|nr:hypothetical protein [Anaerolineales bacterium]
MSSRGAAARPIKYATVIQSVRELNLLGTADYGFWAAHLAGTGLAPLRVDGAAALSLGATDLTWAGRRFNESIIALSVARAAAPETPAGVYLVHAFNSRRALAFMERLLFRTPYYLAAIELPNPPPARWAVRDPAGGELLAAAGSAVRPVAATNEAWEGVIHLPRRVAAPQGLGDYFYARLAGPGERYDFLPAADTFRATPSAASPALGWLRASGFTPREWRYRLAATHAKSASFRQPPPE